MVNKSSVFEPLKFYCMLSMVKVKHCAKLQQAMTTAVCSSYSHNNVPQEAHGNKFKVPLMIIMLVLVTELHKLVINEP